jgi:NAD(P)-dependent dehydrogenase (short-subunit alcohol dehydrogenase family)
MRSAKRGLALSAPERGRGNTSRVTSQTPPLDGLIIAILGGTGEQGRGLARRFAMAGHPVIIGSRSYDRAYGIAQEAGHGICGLKRFWEQMADRARGVSTDPDRDS